MQHRILMVKLAAVGDVLRTTSLLPAIQKRYPGAKITWITEPDAARLFFGNEEVDEVVTTASGTLMARLAVEEFDVILCPDTDLRTAALAAAARGKERHGFTMDEQGRVLPLSDGAERWFRMGISDELKKANTETYQTLVARALGLDPAHVGRPILEPGKLHRDRVGEFCRQHGLDGPIVGINTGAGRRWRYKRWNREHQREFVDAMTGKGVHVLLLGGPEEADVHAKLARDGSGARAVSAGNDLSLDQFAAFVERCSVLVTGDTLALHVATAREVPVVALFGPTSAAEIDLYGLGVKVQPDALACLVCYLPDCDVKPHCQELITPERVVAAVDELLPG